MPWNGLPASKWPKMERCVKDVMNEGKSKEAAIKICMASMTKEAGPAAAPFIVYKQSDGAYRWVAISSNSYEDRDREIVSQKALEADCDRADADGQYGPLRWWHVGLPDPLTQSPGPGLDIGECDFNAMHGRMLVESGTFKDAKIAEALQKSAPDLQLSIGFFHPVAEPDGNGVYQHVRRFERSLLPAGKASNRYTSFAVAQEGNMATFREKLEEFKRRFGGDSKVTEEVTALAEAMEKEAQTLGIATKDADAPPPAPPEPIAPAAKEEPPAPAPEPTPAPAIPTVDEIAALVVEKLKPVLDGLTAQAATASTATKEAQATLAAGLAQVSTAQGQLDARLKALETVQPRGYRATQDPATEATATVKDKKPGPDGKRNEFIEFVMGTSVPPAQ